MIVLGMLIVWVMRIVSEAASISTAVMGPAVLWIAFLFSGLQTQEWSFATEEHENCIAGLLLAPMDRGTIYIAKLLINITMLCVFEVVIVPVVFLTFNVGVGGRWVEFIVVLLFRPSGIFAGK